MTNLNVYTDFGISSLNDNYIMGASHDNSAFAIQLRSEIATGNGDWGTSIHIGSLKSKGL